MNINNLTASKIKEIRTQMGYSADSIASELGIAKSNYSRLENGKVEITLSRIQALSQILKMPLQAFLPINNNANINITNGENSPNYQTINQSDPKFIEAIQSSIELLSRSLDMIVKK